MSTILVVDDEAEIREIVAESLALAGYVVHQSDGADAALVVLAATPAVALLLTDIRMPDHGHDGTYLAGEAHRLYPAMGVILMTGFHVNGEVFPVIRKPFRMAVLTAAISATLAGLPVVV
jgi:DNA-binding NtrC family response regulator